jgi:hypothetical protein
MIDRNGARAIAAAAILEVDNGVASGGVPPDVVEKQEILKLVMEGLFAEVRRITPLTLDQLAQQLAAKDNTLTAKVAELNTVKAERDRLQTELDAKTKV